MYKVQHYHIWLGWVTLYEVPNYILAIIYLWKERISLHIAHLRWGQSAVVRHRLIKIRQQI